MINWPQNLIDDIANQKSVLYLGSGVSANSKNEFGKRPATWKIFLTDILEKKTEELAESKDVIISLLKKEDYLMACEVIVNILGDRVFGDLAADEFRRPGYQPGDLHGKIFSLDSRIVITPNVDKIYDQYATSSSNGTVVIKTYKDNIASFLRSPDFLIIKAHGTIDDTDHMIFTHGQYSKARNENASFYRILDALMLTHTFIFLGCGVYDPDIQLTLENYNFSFPGCRPHYFITEENSIVRDVKDCLAKNRNLEFLTYENEDGTHSQLLTNLKELDSLVSGKRQEIAGTSW
jgi:hypothetical protein